MKDSELLKIIGDLEPYQRSLLVNTIEVSRGIKRFIEETKITPEEFCKDLKIETTQFSDFVNGNWNYSIRETCVIEAMWTAYRAAQVKVEILEVPE